MTKYPFIFWVEYYNIVNETICRESGCTFAKTYKEAMDEIEKFYGTDLESCLLKCKGDYPDVGLITFSNYDEGEKVFNKD